MVFRVNVSLGVTCHALGALWRPEIKLLNIQNRPSASDAVEPSVALPVLLGNLPPRSSAQDPCHRSIDVLVLGLLDLPCVAGLRELRSHGSLVKAWVMPLGSDE